MKNKLRILSVVLTLFLVMTSLTVLANGDYPRLTVGDDNTYDINIGVSNATELDIIAPLQQLKDDRVAQNVTGTTQSVNATIMMIMKLPVPQLEAGKTLDKYILRFAAQMQGSPVSFLSIKQVPISTDLTATGLYSAISANPDANDSAIELKKSTTFGSLNVRIVAADISSYAKACYNAGQEYFYVGVKASSTIPIYSITIDSSYKNADGYNYKDLFPYGYYTQADADELELSSITNPVGTSDDLSFVFSNPIDASSVSASDFTLTNNLSGDTVSVSDSDITVSGATVSLSKSWDNYGSYNATLSGISDVYGQTLTEVCSTSFETASGVETTAVALDTFLIETDKTTIKDGSTNYNKVSASRGYVLYKFDISGIDNTKAVIGADFKFTSQRDYPVDMKVVQVPNGTWTDMTSLASDLTNNSYYDAVDAAYNLSENIADTVSIPFPKTTGTYNVQEGTTADVSVAVSKAVSEGSDYVTFAFHDTNTHNFYTKKATPARYQPSLTVTLADPSFDVVKASPTKCGMMDGVFDPIKLNLATTIDDAYATNDYIKLMKVGEVSEAPVNISKNGSEITIVPTAELDGYSEYKVVLKSGITDIYTNSLSSDKTVTRFTTATALELFDIKFTSELSPIYDEAVTIENYNADSSVTAVAKIKNKSSNDYDAIMIIALYDNEGSLISVDVDGGPDCAPAGDVTQFAKTIEIPEGVTGTTVKAFIWDSFLNIRPLYPVAEIQQAPTN